MLWKTRDEITNIIKKEYINEEKAIIKAFETFDSIVSEYPKNSPFFRITKIILAKSRSLLHCIYSLVLDGHGQEAGAILRVILEALELLIYLRDDPNRIEKVLEDKLPSAGEIAKKNGSSSKELKNYLSNNSAHLKLTFDSTRHLLKFSNDEYDLELNGSVNKKALRSNLSLVVLYLFHFSSIALDCLYINNLSTAGYEEEVEKVRESINKFL